jgi:hypothetical protein
MSSRKRASSKQRIAVREKQAAKPCLNNQGQGLWIPAFAGTTADFPIGGRAKIATIKAAKRKARTNASGPFALEYLGSLA